MVRTQVSFDEELYRRAKRAAHRRGVSFAELCRKSVAEAIATEDSEKPWMRYMGILEGGADDSARVDEIVYGRKSP